MTTRIPRKVLFILPVIIGSALLMSMPLHNSDPAKINDDFQSQYPIAASNPPFGSIQLSTDEVYRGQTLAYNVTVAAIGFTLEQLLWSVDIQNNTGNLSTLGFETDFGNPQLNSTWTPDPNTVSAGNYWVVLWIKNDTDETTVYKNFTILNNLPVFHSLSADKSSAKRAESFNVTVNVTDAEITNFAPSTGNIYVRVYYRDTLGVTSSVNTQAMGGGNYSAIVNTIGLSSPTGAYTFWVGVQDYRPGMETPQETISSIILVTILNQNPTINLATGLIVNDQYPSSSDVSVRMGNTINITITASDPENSVRFILINLKHIETDTWINYTMNYLNFPHTLIINSEDLQVGTWAFYITVVDVDGGKTVPPQNPTIEILPELWTIAAPIVFLLIGILVGLAVGYALLSWRVSRKSMKTAAETPAEAEEVTRVVEKPRKAPPQAEQEETTTEEEESTAGEEETESKTQMKRKIRRRIN